MTMYAVYGGDGIWAIGATPEEALEEFYLDGRDRVEYEAEFGSPNVAPMTERLSAFIEAQGYFDAKNDVFTILPDGTLDLVEELWDIENEE